MKIFLDDERNTKDCLLWMDKRIGKLSSIYSESWEVVRNYDDFVNIVTKYHDEITHISFDHDLGEDVARNLRKKGFTKKQARAKKKLAKSGHDCAKWLRDFYDKNNFKFPVMFVHSQNTVGTQNIINLF